MTQALFSIRKPLGSSALALAILAAASPSYAELTANASVANNYIWRGLTQNRNAAVVQGGIDYGHESGFYAGTWVSNVSYDADDAYSYEHDLYLGFAGEASGLSYDLGYLYYNYDENAGFDFSEIYGSIGFGGLTLSLNVLAHAEPDEGPGQDFSAGEAYYAALDYAFPVANGAELGLHLGYHEGDFVEAFNGVGMGYFDYGISLSKDGFMFMISGTDLGDDDDNDGVEDYASMSARDNDEIKFTLSYSVNFDL